MAQSYQPSCSQWNNADKSLSGPVSFGLPLPIRASATVVDNAEDQEHLDDSMGAIKEFSIPPCLDVIKLMLINNCFF